MENVYWQKVDIFLDKSHMVTNLELSDLKIDDKEIVSTPPLLTQF